MKGRGSDELPRERGNSMNNVFYGESMYGGYYLEWINEDGERNYRRFEKVSELKRFAKELEIDIKNACRFDN